MGDTTAVSTGMDAIMGSMSTISSLLASVWDVMTANPLLTLFLAAGLITIGVRVFRQIKRAAR